MSQPKIKAVCNFWMELGVVWLPLFFVVSNETTFLRIKIVDGMERLEERRKNDSSIRSFVVVFYGCMHRLEKKGIQFVNNGFTAHHGI